MGPADQNLGKEAGKVCRWRHSRAPWIGSLVGYERATPAVLTFLWDTKVGEFVSLTALGGGARVEEEAKPALEEGEEGGPAPLRMYLSFVLLFISFLLFLLFLFF